MPATGPVARLRDDARGQSATIGVILILAIAVVGVTAVVALGSSAVNDVEHAMEIGSAEHAMTEFDSQASLVSHGGSTVQRATLPTSGSGTVQVRDDIGRMNITIINRTDDDEVEMVVMNESLGAVVYENGDTTIAYQGGGVWKRSPGGSTMVSPPEFHYRSNTLTVPLVLINGSGTVGSDALVRQDGQTIGRFPDESADRTNPLQGGEIEVTVTSDYYRAWGRFFEFRTGGDVSYDHDDDQVTIRLAVPASSPGVGGGIVSGSAADELQLGNKADVDSYNSSDGDFASTEGENTNIFAGGAIKLENQATIHGDLVAGGSVTMQNQAHVNGNVSYGGTFSNTSKSTVDGWVAGNGSVDAPDPVDWLIEEKIESFSSGNDNNATDAIDNNTNTLQNCADETCELSAGDYYLAETDLDSDDEVVLNTSGGMVEVAVDGDLELDGDATVEVTGGGVARFYVGEDYQLQNQANVSVPGERSPGMWVYVPSDESVDIGNQARFVGVVYGPGGGSEGADIDVSNKAQVYGGLVGNVEQVPNGVGIHFDEALSRENPLQGIAGSAPTVTYLHVSMNPVNVTAA